MVTIASIPVALPAVLSVTMAVGARYLAKREAVVSHLPAVEEMSGVDVLCADKTGTITKNELAIADVAAVAEDVGRDDVLREAALTAEHDGQRPDRRGRSSRRSGGTGRLRAPRASSPSTPTASAPRRGSATPAAPSTGWRRAPRRRSSTCRVSDGPGAGASAEATAAFAAQGLPGAGGRPRGRRRPGA